MPTNPGCASCDYFTTCGKQLIITDAQGNETKILAKNQDQLRMKCVNKVQDICRDCVFFKEKKCASWKVLNGEVKNRGTLSNCPKKVPLKELC